MSAPNVLNVLVAGGAGYIGSHAVRKLLKAGHHVTVVDDLSHGNAPAVAAAGTGLKAQAELVHSNVGDREAMIRILREKKIDVILHFAACIEVGESVADPGKYYQNNFSMALGLIDAARDAGIKRIVFSSTAAVYGNPIQTPITEDQARAPINPYGRSKMMVELALEDYAAAYGMGYTVLRYFNVAGASPDGVIGEAHEPESHLLPRILMAAAAGKPVGIFGTDYPTPDGTCIRDYVHVDDLVDAHLLAMAAIEPGKGRVYNLGSESGFSVREVIAACSKVLSREIAVEIKERRPGDPAVLVASSARIRKELGWKPSYADLETIVRHAWAWHTSHPGGYAS